MIEGKLLPTLEQIRSTRKTMIDYHSIKRGYARPMLFTTIETML